jgi:hypothetical protein
MVPPVAGRVLLLPSSPVTTTVVALVAVTVSVELAPAATEVGLAAMVTAGDPDPVVPGWVEPQPATSKNSEHEIAAMSDENVEPSGRRTRTFMVLILPMFR